MSKTFNRKNYNEVVLKYIEKSIKENLDLEVLMNPRLSPDQAKEIYLGLKYGLDVSFYNNLNLTRHHKIAYSSP